MIDIDEILRKTIDNMIVDPSLPEGTILLKYDTPTEKKAGELFDDLYPPPSDVFNEYYRGTAKRWFIKGYVAREELRKK